MIESQRLNGTNANVNGTGHSLGDQAVNEWPEASPAHVVAICFTFTSGGPAAAHIGFILALDSGNRLRIGPPEHLRVARAA
eukprot:scaffold64617_cov35-Tisochrysis_lutea.AAC.2